MDCILIEAELVAFHFDTLEERARGELEAHLGGCAGCVQKFLALKRTIERGPDDAVPSELSRARLRARVAGELARRTRRRWAVRAAAAAAVVLLAAGGLWAGGAFRGERRTGETIRAPLSPASVDSARREPENLYYL